jgi:multidrug efflux pump subunit AcrA (membrane-fusion protein)
MADDDLARLHLDKTQLGRRGARKSRVILVLLLVAAMLGGGWLYRTGALTPAIPIRLVNAATLYPAQTLALLNASGYVVAQRKAALGSKITSRLVYLGVAEGQRVKEGQVVARLENEDMLAARNRAQANIAVARATLAQVEAELRDATQSFERAQEMRARKFASPSDYDAAENRLRRARAAVAVAQASLRASEAALAEYLGVPYVSLFCNGMMALQVGLQALRITGWLPGNNSGAVQVDLSAAAVGRSQGELGQSARAGRNEAGWVDG